MPDCVTTVLSPVTRFCMTPTSGPSIRSNRTTLKNMMMVTIIAKANQAKLLYMDIRSGVTWGVVVDEYLAIVRVPF